MKKRQKEIEEKYEAQWDGGRGSHHPDYNPEAVRLCQRRQPASDYGFWKSACDCHMKIEIKWLSFLSFMKAARVHVQQRACPTILHKCCTVRSLPASRWATTWSKPRGRQRSFTMPSSRQASKHQIGA